MIKMLSNEEKEIYMSNMMENLQMLRAKLGGLTQSELCTLAGVSRQTVVNAEKKNKMIWSTFLAFVFIFSQNEETLRLMEFLNIYPKEYKEILRPIIKKEEREER